MAYQFEEHTADVKFIVDGKTIEEIFLDSFLALKKSISGEIEIIERIEKKISIRGDNLENLLYLFLEEFLVLLDSENFLPSKILEIKIDIEDYKLEAVVIGDKADKYKFSNSVKAVTYSQMEIKKMGEDFKAIVVLDV